MLPKAADSWTARAAGNQRRRDRRIRQDQLKRGNRTPTVTRSLLLVRILMRTTRERVAMD